MTCATIEKRENGRSASVQPTGTAPSFIPLVDIIEDAHEYCLVADVPGATSEGIDIQLANGELTVTAKVPPRQPGDKARCLLREYEVGDFHRTFHVGEGVDASKIEAAVRQGVLTLHLPKAEEVKPRRIKVTTA